MVDELVQLKIVVEGQGPLIFKWLQDGEVVEDDRFDSQGKLEND